MAIIVNQILNSSNILSGSSAGLVTSLDQIRNFGITGDYVEMNMYDPSNKLLLQVSPFTNYRIPSTTLKADNPDLTQELEFSPEKDVKDLNIPYGNYIFEYNILRPKIVNTIDKIFFIKEISSDRTEIRLSTNITYANTTLIDGTLSYVNELRNSGYFKEFYLNFGNGVLLPATNIALDQNDSPTILIKLLNPLPFNIGVLATLSIAEKISNSKNYSISYSPDPVVEVYPSLRGPNFDLELDNVRVNPTTYYNLDQITTSNKSVNSNLQSLFGLVSSSTFTVNIDYTNYSNFVHYSSAARRLNGFVYKLGNIELYTAASASAATNLTSTAQLDALNYQNQINQIIQGFDDYEKFLYYESSSYSWPKSNSTKPYINYSTSSIVAYNWYTGSYENATNYDDTNQNNLIYTLPTYINENSDNEGLFKFVASIGQMFDDIWIHIKAITDLYQAKNSLTEGISKDLVYFALQSLGVNTYTDQDGNDVFQYLYGANANGTYLPPTSSYETLVTASQYSLSGQDQQKGIYKRIYHNLPLLLKSKGTTRFIQYLNTIFGIPSTIMGYTEYGGVDKSISTTEYEFDRFTYASTYSGTQYASFFWNYTTQSYNRTGQYMTPNGIEFRFKTSPLYTQSCSCIQIVDASLNVIGELLVSPIPTGSNNSIYSGSIGNFGYFTLTLGNSSVTSSTIPIFTTGSNGDTSWYNVLLQKRDPNIYLSSSAQYYDLYVKNNIYGEIGHTTSASLYVTNANNNKIWLDPTYASWYFSDIFSSNPFSGSMQEFRLWANTLSESAFNKHVLNPESIEGNNTGSAYDDLVARYPLGNDLYITPQANYSSVHPNQNYAVDDYSFNVFSPTFTSFTETYYTNIANSGYANPVNDKVRIISGSTYGTQLLPNKSIELQPLLPTTKDIHLMDASLSPQDEIDRDIAAQLGSLYSIDDFIGDPSGGSLIGLDRLRGDYFKKYTKPYNYKDYIRLIEFFHNSLFRTLKDFIPARTNIATGIVIKPHILERSTQQINDPNVSQHNNLSQSIATLFITSSNGGGYTQPIYNYTINSNLGPVDAISDGRDFFTGELPSSSIFIHDDFEIANYNPFAIGFKSNNTSSYSQSLWNVEFNPKLNNVEQNQISNLRKKLTLIGGNAGFVKGSNYVTESFQLQDFTYKYSRHIKPRYIGTKVTSYTYNTYTTGSYTGSNGFTIQNGDNTFGKVAAIDRQSYKVGWVKTIPSQSLNFYDKTQIQLKYLVDKDSNVIDLTQKNNNLFEVQNTFKSGDTVVLSLSDTIQPSFQKTLDGIKTIFKGGYSYDPILFREDGNSLKFLWQSYTKTSSSPRIIKGYDINKYTYQTNGLQNREVSIYFYTNGYDDNQESPPTVLANQDPTLGQNAHGYNLIVNGQIPSDRVSMATSRVRIANWDTQYSISYPTLNSRSIPSSYDTGYSKGIISYGALEPFPNAGGIRWTYLFDQIKFNNYSSSIGGINNYPSIDNPTSDNTVLFKAPRQSTYVIKCSLPTAFDINMGIKENYGRNLINTYSSYRYTQNAWKNDNGNYGFTLKTAVIIEKSSDNGNTWNYLTTTKITNPIVNAGSITTDSNTNSIHFGPDTNVNNAFRINYQNKLIDSSGNEGFTTVLNQGDILRARLALVDMDGIFYNAWNIHFGFGTGDDVGIYPLGWNVNTKNLPTYFEVSDNTNPVLNYQISTEITGSNPLFSFNGKVISFSQNLNEALYFDSIYTPTSANLPELYSPIVDYTSIQVNDLIRLGSITDSRPDYYTVVKVDSSYFPGVINTNSFNTNASFRRFTTIITVPGFPPRNVTLTTNRIRVVNTPASLQFFQSVFNTPSKQFTVSGITGAGAGNNNRTFTMVSYNQDVSSYIGTIASAGGGIAISQNFVTPIINVMVAENINGDTDATNVWTPIRSGGTYPTTTFTANTGAGIVFIKNINATVNRDLPTDLPDYSKNFAILRPKPDETSVIINYRKKDGDVSQTILIPQDANDEIKASVGTIFQNLNVDLSNQNINTTK